MDTVQISTWFISKISLKRRKLKQNIRLQQYENFMFCSLTNILAKILTVWSVTPSKQCGDDVQPLAHTGYHLYATGWQFLQMIWNVIQTNQLRKWSCHQLWTRRTFNVRHAWVSNSWDRIKKKFLHLDSNVHFSVLNFKNFLTTISALWLGWHQKRLVCSDGRWVTPPPPGIISHHEFVLSCYQSRKWENVRDRSMFQGLEPWAAWNCLKYHKLGSKGITDLYHSSVSLTIKLADHVKKGCTNLNRSNVSKSIRYHSYDI